MALNRNFKIFLKYFLGPILFTWLMFSIYNQIKHQPNLRVSWISIRESLHSPKIWNLVFVSLLMLVNWSIEAIKWKISMHQLQPVSFLKSFRAVLSGVSFSVSTPNRVGEYLGRVLYIEEGNRLRAVSLTIVSSISQLIITLTAGLLGLMYLQKRIESSEFLRDVDSVLWLEVIEYGVAIVLLILTVFYFRLSLLSGLFDKFRKWNRYASILHVLKDLHATLLLKLLSLSAARYIVFAVQYYLLFVLFNVSIEWWQAFWTVSVIFLVLSIIPTFAIAELGLRGEVSLKLLGLFSANSLGIGITTATIWFINLVVPAIAGSLLILSIKIFKNKNEGNQGI